MNLGINWLLLSVFHVKFHFLVSFTVQSTLLECKTKLSNDDKNRIPTNFHTIENCNRKIRVSLSIENKGKTPEGLQYIFVKDVVENSTGNTIRLLNPILFRLRQEQVVLSYPFNYLSAVNGKASEVVINYENRKNYSGCDDTSQINPTCGLKHEKGVVIPYSEGFCCFCPETPVKEKQARGGQDCSLNVGEPDDFEKQKYKASAHCLHMSDIWYSVSALEEPFILHETFLQAYMQKDVRNGSSLWVALTHDEEFELGIKNPFQYDENKTIAATYFTSSPKNDTTMISFANTRLLIPQPMPSVEPEKIPLTIKNGATDYLLIPTKLISSYGDECNMAGISYEAFATQKDRCKVAKDTCLKNQPLDFWEADDERRRNGKKGTHLLQNFGTPYKDPIIIDSKTKEHWLALEYYEKHLTKLTIELNADHIVALPVGKKAQISVVVTSSIGKKIDFYVAVFNPGLVAAKYFVQAVKCGYEVPDSNNVSVFVPPQLKHNFILSSNIGSLELTEKFTCMVEVNSAAYGTVAKRKIVVRPHKRCICNFHCLCVCIGESLKCEPMEEEDYHLAGFRGSLPILTAKPPYKSYFARHPFAAVLIVFLTLLLIGFIKATFVCVGFSRIAAFGLHPCLYQPKKIPHYYEPQIRDLHVIYDGNGYPINPDTKEHARTVPDELFFVLNLFFCFIWPFIAIRECCVKKKEEKIYNNYPEYPEMIDGPTGRLHKHYDTADLLTESMDSSGESGVSDFNKPPHQKHIDDFDNNKAAHEKPTSLFEPEEKTLKGKSIRQSVSEGAIQDAIRRPEPLPRPLTEAQQRWRKGFQKFKAVI